MKDMLIDNHDTNKIQKTQPNIRLLRLIAEYMLRHNLLESASLVAKTFQMRDLLDLDVFAQSKRIRNALLNRDTAECLAWCNDHRSTLKRNKNQLEFELKQQDFIELVRQRRIDDAIIHAKKHLASYRLAYPAIFSRVCALLCHQSDTRLEPYKVKFQPLYSLTCRICMHHRVGSSWPTCLIEHSRISSRFLQWRRSKLAYQQDYQLSRQAAADNDQIMKGLVNQLVRCVPQR